MKVEYFYSGVHIVLPNRVHVFAILCLPRTEKHGRERVKDISSATVVPLRHGAIYTRRSGHCIERQTNACVNGRGRGRQRRGP